jgi:hypothetical protein
MMFTGMVLERQFRNNYYDEIRASLDEKFQSSVSVDYIVLQRLKSTKSHRTGRTAPRKGENTFAATPTDWNVPPGNT